ncbi:hypothetical protein VPH35_047313 [Triticum aestivum]
MEKVKWNCLDYVLKLNCRKNLEVYLTAMESLEKQARSCYSEEVSLGSDMFLRMILLDGCFLLVYLGGTDGLDWCGREPLQYTIAQPEEIMEHASHKEPRSTESMRLLAGTSSNLCSTEGVELDHISTGEECYDRKDPDQLKCDPISEWHHNHAFQDAPDLLTEKICKYLELNIQKYTTVARKFDGQKDFHHLLQLCHIWLHPLTTLWRTYLKRSYFDDMSTNQQTPHVSSCQTLNRWRRAEQYHEAGIEFKSKEHNKHNPPYLLDITFDKGEVQIPCLLIDENTICLFRNLVAFEQTCSQFGNDVTAYISFISQLARIILHHLRTDEEMSTLFSRLGKNVDFDQNGAHYLKSVCRMLEEYYQNRVNRWMAWLWHNHLRNPWLVLAVVAAAIVLLCTVIQLLLALLAYLDQTTDTN